MQFTNLPSTVLLAFLSIATNLCAAQLSTQPGMTADAHCGKGYCFTAIYIPQQSLINYTLVVPKGEADLGWYSVAQGSQMKGANMAIHWTNSDGSLTTSHRSATGEQYPLEDLATSLPALTVNTGLMTSNSSQTIWSWSLAQINSPSSKMNHIFASSKSSPTGKASSSGIPMHDYYESQILLDMTKSYDGSAPASLEQDTSISPTSTIPPSSRTSQGNRNLSQISTRLILVHMILMTLAWILIIPIGVLVARFGRTLFLWFPVHQGIQTLGAIMITVAAALGLSAVKKSSNNHFERKHGKVGLALLIIYGQQLILGSLAHYIRGKTGKRYVGYIHMPLGIALIALSVYTIHLGFEVWNWNPPRAASYFIYSWSAFLLVVYLAGFALLPKELKQASSLKHQSRSQV